MTNPDDRTNDELKVFMQRVLRITPRHNDPFSNGIPGNGAVNVGSDPAHNLQRAALQFAQVFQDSGSSLAIIGSRAAELEGAIMVAETFEIVTEKNMMELVESLHDLVEKQVEYRSKEKL